ncbi:DedA family protein [Belnapia sp. T18]|uniref:DedA family protein n=1 Tax=Belnapia arida TaxID=2804533 RepID=A0ABS1U0V8_9PROT|nr:DedA family protein [Belnapia arida]MBL6078308.1 DedA family protein [Belnapia arida]
MIAWASDLVVSAGLTGVFLLMVAENLFPPIPSEVIMPLAGFAAARGQLSIEGVIAAGIAGSLAGNAFWYEAARAFGAARIRRLADRFGRYVGLTPETLDRAEAALRRNGAAAVCLARMMPGLRTGISVPAGLVALPRPVFYGFSALGTSIWTGGLATAGYLLEDQFHLIEDWAGTAGLALTALILLVVGLRIRRARRAG